MADILEDPWRPRQYERFKQERDQPFHDLVALVRAGGAGETGRAGGACAEGADELGRAEPGMRVLDAGCGTGRLTRELHLRLPGARTLGLDSSPSMLAASEGIREEGLEFQQGLIEDLGGGARFDLVFSNAALQWVDGHPPLLKTLTDLLVPGGQLAIQVPANYDHPSHKLAAEVALEEPFRGALQGYVRRSPVMPPEGYSVLLHKLGYAEQHVRLQVYCHLLESRDEVVEWVKGTLLTQYQRRMPESLFESYLERYRSLLMPFLEDERPFFYPFKRILMWGRKP